MLKILTPSALIAQACISPSPNPTKIDTLFEVDKTSIFYMQEYIHATNNCAVDIFRREIRHAAVFCETTKPPLAVIARTSRSALSFLRLVRPNEIAPSKLYRGPCLDRMTVDCVVPLMQGSDYALCMSGVEMRRRKAVSGRCGIRHRGLRIRLIARPTIAIGFSVASFWEGILQTLSFTLQPIRP